MYETGRGGTLVEKEASIFGSMVLKGKKKM